MEVWDNQHRRHGHDRTGSSVGCHYHRSFSSSLLDAIYRSVDEGGSTETGRQRYEGAYSRVADGKQLDRPEVDDRNKNASVRRTTTSSRRGAVPADDQHRRFTCERQHILPHQRQSERCSGANSTSSSSDSSYGGFCTSDAERPAGHLFGANPRPKPIRASLPPETRKKKLSRNEQRTENSIGDRFRASKLYRDLKKVKAPAPASPVARLAAFINTLFTAKRNRNAGGAPAPGGLRTTVGDATSCSSASSYSRSRLTRTPSAVGTAPSSAGGDTRKSVRFVLGDEDSRRGAPRCLYPDQKTDHFQRYPPASHEAAAPRKPTREAAKEFLRWYEEEEKKKKVAQEKEGADAEAADQEDGAGSYSSSDLFELENLSGMGIGVGGELPVYETTGKLRKLRRHTGDK